MSQQTDYNYDSPVAFAGMKADSGFDRVESALAEGAIPFGHGVIRGTEDDQVKNSDAVALFQGISLHKHKEPSGIGLEDAAYKDTDSVSVMTQGAVWCPIEDSNAPSVDDDVYINVAIGGAELGKVTDVSAGNIATGGVFKQIDSVNKLALVIINRP